MLGNIQIDSNVNIGANSVVLQSVPSYTTVVGIPGHIVKQEGKRIGKTFDHRNLPDPLYEQIKQLENNLKKRRTERLKMITLYNTLTRQKETFEPIEPGKVKMYVCGPTVYNYIHIGNARPAINYDVVRRYFEYKGYEVIYVSNFTDVDDKLINRSKELNESVPDIADRYIKAFYEDVGALNVKKATSNPRNESYG